MESGEEVTTKWGIICNFLEYEQLRLRIHNFLRNHMDGTMVIKPCLPFLIHISNLSLMALHISIKVLRRPTEAYYFK